MNIRQAKKYIENTVKLYLKKDEFGEYRIPTVRQRPIFLLGAPGIGKTAIMEQIAQEMGIALVSYSMTHHTRQSALGLPFIADKNYGGAACRVSEYTMSEIIASVYDTMESGGIREGILFLDEINCVSETLAPAILQFLQYKTFGRHRVPGGWVIVTAGNPPEYNRSVREFDVATLDRLKVMEVEPDYGVWKMYASEKRIHHAVISYLDLKKEHFFRIETWMNTVYTLGGCVLNAEGKSGFDDPKTVAAMEFVDKLVKETMPPASTMSETGTDVLFGSGKVAMISQGSWMVAAFKDNEYIAQHADVARLPKDPETGRSISLYNGLGWSASAGTKNPEGAYKLIEWFASKDMQQKQAELGVTMSAYAGVSDAWVNNTDLFNLQPYLDAMDDAVFRPATKSTLAWWNPMVEELKKPWNGEEDMATACANITKIMNEKIAEEN